MSGAGDMVVELALPADYRPPDALAFHGRDPQPVAERVDAGRIRKGVSMDGICVLLEVTLDAGPAAAQTRCAARADGALSDAARGRLRVALDGMLGLRLDPRPFAALAADDALLGPLVGAQAGLRIMQTASVFEALSWAIIGQQINLPFALALRRSLIELAGPPAQRRAVVLSGAGARGAPAGRGAHQPQIFARQSRHAAARGADGR